ncbi:MAG: hypothetical protein M0Z41_03595 [Peptococcaceae bacterium]|nr:hypothetical protein [Peptococcaceae bacterium]
MNREDGFEDTPAAVEDVLEERMREIRVSGGSEAAGLRSRSFPLLLLSDGCGPRIAGCVG